MKKKWLLVTLITVFFISLFSFIHIQTAYGALEPGEYTIKDILAKDFINIPKEHPDNYEEVKKYVESKGKINGRTGWSAQILYCDNSELVENAEGELTPWNIENQANTSDSGRDHEYEVSDYHDEIIASLTNPKNPNRVNKQKAELIYEAALESGKKLVYQEGSKKMKSSAHNWPVPCNDGDLGWYYNDQDFMLTLTFTIEDDTQGPGLKVIPPEQTIYVGEQAQYQAIYTKANGEKIDVTNDAVWKVINTNYATSEGQGKFTGTAKGFTTITAVFDGKSDTAYLEVLNKGEEPEPEEPPKEPNKPPVAIINAPDVVELGETFCIRSDSYDSDGYIVFNDWYFGGELDEDDEEGFTEETTSKCGVYYEDAGEQEVWLQVTDDDGSSDDTTHTIEVVYPVPTADFEVNGYPIENRAVWLTPGRPYGKNDTAERKFKIVENKWTIRALDNENQSAVIVIEDDLNNSDYTEEIELLFRKQGDYEVTHYIKNNRGQSDTKTKIVTIEEDLVPTGKIETSELVYLNTQGKQTVTFDIKSASDDDFIGNNILEIAHDHDNDGSFEDETWQLISNSSLTQINYTVTKLGNYKVRLTSIETFNEPTYESHVNLSTDLTKTDRKYAQAETTFKVDNMAPVVSLDAKEQKNIEVIFDMGDVGENGKYTKAKLQSQINSNLLPSLAAESINADIRVEERKYYEDIEGNYYYFYFDPRHVRTLDKRRIEPVVYYMDFNTGKLDRVNLPYEAIDGMNPKYGSSQTESNSVRDYDGNVYYNVVPENTSDGCEDCGWGHWWRTVSPNGKTNGWANTDVEIFKYEKDTDSVAKFLDKQRLIDELDKRERRGSRRLEQISLRDMIVGENEKIYLLLKVVIATNGYDDTPWYLLEMTEDGRITNMAEFPASDDEPLSIFTITKENIYFLQDREYVNYSSLSEVWEDTYHRTSMDVDMNTRLISTDQYEYYYGIELDDSDYELHRLMYNKDTKVQTSQQLLEADFIEYEFEGYGDRMQITNYTLRGTTRLGSLFLGGIQWYYDGKDAPKGDFYASLIVDDSNFAMNSQPYKNQPFSTELSNLILTSSNGSILFGQDGTYVLSNKNPITKVDEKTNTVVKTITPSTTDSFGPYCSYDDDKGRCGINNRNYSSEDIAKGVTAAKFHFNKLPVRAYKKTLADTLADTEWKSETSTKYYVTLSDEKIKDLPDENEEVASLLDEKDIRYISIDTTSTKSIAQQVRDAIEQDSLQVTTTYNDANMKNAMGKISDFIIGDIFPPEDPTIDIHLGVDDSQYSLTAVRTAINNILKPNLLNAGYTDINITAESLVNKTVNGQSVRKFNTTIENEYYVLFKDTALSNQNLNHLVGDLLLQDSYFVGIGKQAAKTQFDTVVNKNMYRGLTINEPSSINDAMEKLSDYLIDTIKAREGESVIYATTEANKVLYKANYWDYENNPKFKEVYKTTHDPSVFENDQGKITFASGSLAEVFTKVGLYKPSYQAQDDPLVNYTATEKNQFAEYRKWSNVADKAKIYIHRLPVADFVIKFNKTTREFSAKNAAYDLDKQSIDIGLGGGIAKQQFQWRKKGEIIWRNGLPSSPLDDITYEIKNEVTDFQNQTAYLIKEVNKIGPPVAQFTPNPSVIEQGDSVNFINTSYEPTGEDMVAQWYYKRPNDDTYIPFATGSFTNGVGNANWNPTTSLLKDIGIYDIRLVVTDEDGMTDEAVQQVEVVKKTNNPPIACMQIPSPNYIGDTITIINCASDEDGDPLTYSYKVTKPNGSTTTYNSGHPNVAANGDLKIVANQHPMDLGTWTIIQTVSDGKAEATATGNMIVLDQTIQGEVAHTEQWLKNLQKYNLKNPSKAFNLNSSGGLLEFIPGERFVLYTTENTTNRLVSAEAYIKESSRGINYKSLYGTATLNRMDSKKFTGSLWDESMVEKFKDGEVLTFEFIGTFTNGWVDTHTVQIRIKDDPYWRQHTTY